MRKLTALALAVPLALGLGVVTNAASAAPVSSGALNVLMTSEALKDGGSGETVKDGLIEPAYYYGYRRRYYRPYYQPYGYYGGYGYGY
jgi:hypothetical protein